jgi:hypothetical protein
MTLSPVFRSPEAVGLLEQRGVWERLAPAIESQARAVRLLHSDLHRVIDPRYLASERLETDSVLSSDPDQPSFIQEYFFLILFRSLFESLGIRAERLETYAELNFCIKGTITAADNIFDDQDKSLLPFKPVIGARFLSILQLMCFERLVRGACDRAVAGGVMSGLEREQILRGILDRMAEIGQLEGSEEGGVREILPPDRMVAEVHRVRGGALFALAFVAPRILEIGEMRRKVRRAEPAVAHLGTAFQIVDDLTDFEFDLGRHSHNLLVSEIHHHGESHEVEELNRLWSGAQVEAGMVEGVFRTPARRVLERAYEEARSSFRSLEELGFWFPPELADEVVHAIVGLDGVARMEALTVSGD